MLSRFFKILDLGRTPQALPSEPESFRSHLRDRFGDDITQGSMISHEHVLRPFLKIFRPKCTVEIGTRFGLSAALLAQYSENVVTIDKHSSHRAQRVWRSLEREGFLSRGLIQALHTPSNEGKRQHLNRLSFDFAFIDGGHLEQDVRLDLEAVRKCGCVLFHDYKPAEAKFAGVVKVVQELRPSVFLFGSEKSPFALWASDAVLSRRPELVDWLAKNTRQIED